MIPRKFRSTIICLFVALINFAEFVTPSSRRVFVLIGGTGELSAKYLWDALYRQIYLNPDRADSIQVFTSGRSDDKEGKQKLQKILKNLHCGKSDGAECSADTKKFAESIEYLKLENDPDYAKFCHDIFNDKNDNQKNLTEIFWYLATPPTYYPMILMSIHTRCRLVDAVRMKIALEKPFWKNTEEYAILSRILSGRFSPNELYFVDHYLAKETAQILPQFKKLNADWLKMKRLDQLELVLLEREYVKDTRLNYYDSYGVVRDVMQSHFNEILLKLLEDEDESSCDEEDERESIRELLNRFRLFSRSSWLIGQHANYRLLTKYKSKTPTFASVQLRFDISPDSGDTVERDVLLVSGKYMDSKRSYARMTFRNTAAAAEESAAKKSISRAEKSGPVEAIFLFTSPVILVKYPHEISVKAPDGWAIAEDNSEICRKWLPRLFTNSTCDQLITLTAKMTSSFPSNPYETIVDNFVKEKTSSADDAEDSVKRKSATFTKMAVVEESWKLLWSHVLKEVDQKEPTIYEKPEEMLQKIFPNQKMAPKIEL